MSGFTKDCFTKDAQGTIALIDAALQRGVSTFVLESSVLTGASTLGPLARLGYAALNFGTNALDRKQEAEAALKAAAAGGRLQYTIVRPAALTNDPEEEVGVPFTRPADSILGGVGCRGTRLLCSWRRHWSSRGRPT